MKKIYFSLLLPFFGLLAATPEDLTAKMTDFTPEIRSHLAAVLEAMNRTGDGKFVLANVSPDIRFQLRPMAQLGQASTRNVVTLEALRLDNEMFRDTTERHVRIKVCFSAEILTHELLHNAQFRAGLFPDMAKESGYNAVLIEKLLEMQAKYTGEKMFYDLRELPENRDLIQPKTGLYLYMQRTSKEPAKEYMETLWNNRSTTSAGRQLYREQFLEIAGWNAAYAEQAFRNYHASFLLENGTSHRTDLTARMQKIIDFTSMPVSVEYLLKNAPVRPVPNGIVCYENGKAVLEFRAIPGGYLKRQAVNGSVRETKVIFK